jgi:hypothetical protein
MFDLIGWTGAFLILFAYFQAARNVWPSNSRKASIINGLAGTMLGISALVDGAWPNFGLEIAFVFIAITTFIKAK